MEFYSCFFTFKICLVALIELFSSSFFNHRYSYSLNIFSKTNSKYLIQHLRDLGGSGFFAHARMCNPKIICCGYQHSSIFPHHHSIRRRLNSFYDPDILFEGMQSFKFSKSTLFEIALFLSLDHQNHTTLPVLYTVPCH